MNNLRFISLILFLSALNFVNCSDDENNNPVSQDKQISFTINSGDNQNCLPGASTVNRLEILYEEDGEPVFNKVINFKTIQGAGYTTAKPTGVDEVNQITDHEGKTSVFFNSTSLSEYVAYVKATVVDDPSYTVTFTINVINPSK